MKLNKFLLSAIAAASLTACSDSTDVVKNDKGQWNADGTGYVSLSIKMPDNVTSNGTRAAGDADGSHNDQFNDGDLNEYAVYNAMLVIFTGDGDAEGNYKLAAAYNLPLTFNGKDPEHDQISSISTATTKIDAINAAKAKALVILNKPASITLDESNHMISLNGASLKDKTFADFQKVSQHQISLLRDTKQVNITLRQTVDPSNMDDADYDVKVYDTNGRLLYNNEPDATDTRLCYTPYTQWTTTLGTRAEGETANLMHTAHYELMMNRLVAHQNNVADARLIITNKRTGKEVANVNLPALLADGRRAYERYNYSAQEYLDREYQFALDFYLVGDKWQYISVSIAALSWSYRVQNVEL